jgi:hypothetical protein
VWVGNIAAAARLILRSLLWSEDEEADCKALRSVEENVANSEGGSEEEVHSDVSYGSKELRVALGARSDCEDDCDICDYYLSRNEEVDFNPWVYNLLDENVLEVWILK